MPGAETITLRERREGELVWIDAAGDSWRAAFSTRRGGVSQGPFATLNIGYSVADQQRAVAENRRRLTSALGVEVRDLVVPGQVHGTTVARVGLEERGRGAYGRETVVHDTDGLLTSEPQVPLMITSADCVPVAIVARGAGGVARLALVHAGWRGMLAGIVAKAARELVAPATGRRSGAARLVAAVVGPSIGPCHFAVGDDVGLRFAAAFPGVWEAGSVDLWRAAEQQLLGAGLDGDRIAVAGVCTACDERFFSYRRDEGHTGRQAAIAWLT